ncbi:MAG TPA: energy transducer TonB [Candidatus Binatia bacterium]|nr:energy transducer TonB [Candidatus Binatia bacterium]
MAVWLTRWRTLALGVSCLLHLAVVIVAEQWSVTAYAAKPPVLPVELVTLEEAPTPEPPRKLESPNPGPPRPLRLPKPIETPLPKMAETVSEPPPIQSSVKAEPVQTGPSPAATTVTGPASPAAEANGLSSGPPAAATAPAPSLASAPSGGSTGAVTRLARPQGGYQVRPTYPSTARRLGIQGTTLLKVYVLIDGRIGEIVVQESAGHPDLDQASVDAVRRWRFEPARRGNDPVAMWVLLPVEFRLK